MASKPQPKRNSKRPTSIVNASVLSVSIRGTMTLLDEDEAALPAEEGNFWAGPGNEMSFAIDQPEGEPKQLIVMVKCKAAFTPPAPGEPTTHTCFAQGAFKLEGESTKLPVGADVELTQVWPYVSMVLWAVKEHVREQLFRIGGIPLQIGIPTPDALQQVAE